MTGCWSKVREVLFATERPYVLAAVRVLGALVLLQETVLHWPDAVELYSTAGPAIPAFASWPVASPLWAAGGCSLLVVALVTLCLGWHSRASAWLAWALSLWLWPLDAPGTFAKYSVLGIHLLFWLGVGSAGKVWSVDAMLRPGQAGEFAFSLPRRMLQALVCAVYFGAVLTKLHTPGYLNGDLLSFSLLDEHWGTGNWGAGLARHPQWLLMGSLSILAVEALFPVLIWFERSRRGIWLAVVLLHTILGCLLHIGIFSPLMLVLLLAFVEERDWRWVAQWQCWRMIQRTVRGWKWLPAGEWLGIEPEARLPNSVHFAARPQAGMVWSWGAILVAWGGLASLGALGLWWLDRSEVFGNRPPAVLQELEPGEVELRLTQQLPPYSDYLHRVELGQRFGGNQTFGARDHFPRGSTVYLLVQTVSAHPALTISGVLLDPQGNEVRRATTSLDAASTYTVLAYELLPAFAPGEYRVILQAEGTDVWQRRFRVR